MTVDDFCKKYGIPLSERDVVEYVVRTKCNVTVTDDLAGKPNFSKKAETQILFLYRKYKQELDAKQAKAEEERRVRLARAEEERRFLAEEDARIQEVVRVMPITSTPSFDGYRIVEYGGYVSGDEAIELTDGLFTHGDFRKDTVNDKIKAIRSIAIDELKTAAAQIGCNAVVGLDFDYVTIDRQIGDNRHQTFIILTANGTAVTIEPL